MDELFPVENCQKCGAGRPKIEIQHQACGNCQNLEALREDARNAKANEEAQKKAIESGQEQLKSLPKLDKPATSLYDNEVGVWWFGIDLKNEKADPISLMLILDQAKPGLLQVLGDWRIRQAKKDSLVIKTKDSVVGLIDSISNAGQKVKKIFTKA